MVFELHPSKIMFIYKDMSIILGIDQSFTKTGIIVLDECDNIIHARCVTSDSNDESFKRAWDISTEIIEVALQYKPSCIMIEGLAFGAVGNAARDLSGLQFVIVSSLRYQHHFNVKIVSPRSVKKLACGNGNAKKTEVLKALPQHILDYFKNLGFKKTNGLTDLADAYWIAKSHNNTI